MRSLSKSNLPIVATISVVVRHEKVLLVRRANPPDSGKWGFPGGKIEIGENVLEAALRELKEETGVEAIALKPFTAVDAYDCNQNGDLRNHFVLVAVLCQWIDGDPIANDDALEASWFELEELTDTDPSMSLDVAKVATEGAALMAKLELLRG